MGSFRRSLMIVDRLLKSTAAINRSSVWAAASSPNLAETLLRPQYGHVNAGVCRCYSNNYSSNTQSHAIDLSNEESRRRIFNRLLYRSKQRGFLELDLVLGKWVEEHIHSLDENGIKALCVVLDLENPDLWKWLTGQEQPPEPIKTNLVFNAVCGKVMNNLKNHAAPETRATAGQPWVRGWDDFKKGRDSPITGNQ